MKTSEYKWYNPPFDEYNEAQAKVIPYLDSDCNLVICLNTAVGKTVLAEGAFAWHLQNSKLKCVFTAPLKSISAEKHREWTANKALSQYDILVANGDNRATEDQYDASRIIITTTETLDNRLRNISPGSWLHDVGCMVVDESHLIGTEGRGVAVESTLMRMSKVNPNVRFLLLSATMDNGVQIAKWLKKLNGKKTFVIQSDWRPTEVTPRFHTHEEDSGYYQTDFKNKNKDKWKNGKTISDVNRIQETIRVLKSEHYEGCKTIIFVQSKAYGKSLGRAIIDSGIRCGFHNASVDKNIRHKMEQAFNDPYSGYDVLVATSTLSAGVNIGV